MLKQTYYLFLIIAACFYLPFSVEASYANSINASFNNDNNSSNMNEINKYNTTNLTSLYNSTVNSVVKVTSYDAKNYSVLKSGSGFVYNHDGNLSIITAANIINSTYNVTVTMSDGSTFSSDIIGIDPITNIAVLSTKEANNTKLFSLPLTNSSNIQVGQQIATIGNPQGYSQLFNYGIVSGVEQSIPTFGPSRVESLTKTPNGIITNLVLGPSFSGSPVFDTHGQIIGMNVENYTFGPVNLDNYGISFVIPSNTINKIVTSILTKGYYLHPWLGASGTDITPDIAKALNLTESKGFLVISVANNSPAKKAGILGGDNTTSLKGRPITLGGDVIIGADNKDIKNIHELLRYIESEKNVGDAMTVTVMRNGLLQSIHVKLDANPNYSVLPKH